MQDYQTAVSELRSGRKESHWIWYIMPMMAGIGYSSMCQTYGVPSLDHATGYLLHPTLGPRLAEVVGVVHSQICERNLKLQRLMGSDVDARKAVSCLVLFRAAAEPLMSTEATVPFDVAKFRDQATLVLNAVATSYPACPFTTDYLKRQQTGICEASDHEDVAPSSGEGASQLKAQCDADMHLQPAADETDDETAATEAAATNAADSLIIPDPALDGGDACAELVEGWVQVGPYV